MTKRRKRRIGTNYDYLLHKINLQEISELLDEMFGRFFRNSLVKRNFDKFDKESTERILQNTVIIAELYLINI